MARWAAEQPQWREAAVEEDCLPFPLNTDIEAICRLPIHFATLGNQGFTPLRLLDQVEHRALGIGLGLIIEIQARVQVDVDPPGKQADVDVRCHWHTGGVFHHAWLHRMRRPLTRVKGGSRAAKAVEGVFQVVGILVLTVGVGLPELQERVPHQVAIAVIHMADQQNMLAGRIRLGQAVPDFLVAGRVAGRFQGQADVHVGAGGLRRGFRQQFDWHGGVLSSFRSGSCAGHAARCRSGRPGSPSGWRCSCRAWRSTAARLAGWRST